MTPAPSTPVEGTGEQRCVHCGQSPDDPGASMCQIDGISTGKLHDFQPGEGAGRPDTAALRYMAKVSRGRVNNRVDWERTLLDAADWIDTQPPASPADDVPDADAVAFQNGYQIGVRVGSEHHGPCRGLPPASPVPPTPTPCPYIVTGGEGTSYCSLAERSAMHAAAPPSTPAEQPDPDGLSAAELLADLKDRTERGMVELEKLAAPLGACMERTRLLGKLAGLALVADWLRSYDRPTDLTGSEA